MTDAELPYQRVGHCCGCNRLEDVLLTRVWPGVFRYRCAECLRLEHAGHVTP